jgi:ribose transport system permease protein
MNNVAKGLRSTVAGPVASLLLAVVIISLTTNRFLDPGNIKNLALEVAVVAIIAIGSTLVILTGGIDLSPGSNVALTTCMLAILVKNDGLPLPVGMLLILVLGAGLGLVNGFLSTYGRLPSFIVTLATLSVYRGLAFLVTGGSPIFSVSPDLNTVFYGSLLGVPLPFYYVVTLYILALVFLRHTITGRAIYAVGGNESAARLSGIRVNRTRLIAFVIAGVMASIGGLLTAAQLDSGSPNYGQGLELSAIAAAVIGGASLAGGYGNVVFTLFGAMTVAVVQNGLNLNAVPTAYQEITLGVIIVLAVALDMWRADIGRGIAHVTHLLPFAGRAEQSARQAEQMETQPKR